MNTKKKNLILMLFLAMIAGLLALMGVIGFASNTVKAASLDVENPESRYDIEDDLDREKFRIDKTADDGVDYYAYTHKKLKTGNLLKGKVLIFYSLDSNETTTEEELTITFTNLEGVDKSFRADNFGGKGIRGDFVEGEDTPQAKGTNGQNYTVLDLTSEDVPPFLDEDWFFTTETVKSVGSNVYYLEELSEVPEAEKEKNDGNNAEEFENAFKDWVKDKADKLGLTVSELTGYSIGGGAIILFVIAAIVWRRVSGNRRRR